MNDYFEFFTKYFNFKGRTSRKIYWLTQLFLFLMWVILVKVVKSSALWLIWSIAIYIPNISIQVRRLHDSNKSGIWILAPYLSLLAALISLTVAGGLSYIKQGIADEVTAGLLISQLSSLGLVLLFMLTFFAFLLVIFIFTLLPSVNENNKYDE